MSQAAFLLATAFEQIDCHKCAASYALVSDFVDRRRKEGGSWHCPYCDVSHGRFEQRSRKYGDYFYAQDREKFEADFIEWKAGRLTLSAPISVKP